MKYLISRDQLFESNDRVGKNSVVLIKGKEIEGKRKLYVSSITGYTELRPGATMLFLSDYIYRVLYDGNRFTYPRVDYREDSDLKDALNVKSPDRIAIMKNNNKTPYHWITLKETMIVDAVKKAKDNILSGDYDLGDPAPSESKVEEIDNIGNIILTKIFNSISDPDTNEIDILESKNPNRSLEDQATEGEGSSITVDWSIELQVLDQDSDLWDKFYNLFDSRKATVELFFNSEVDLAHDHDEGDREVPPMYSTEVVDVITELETVVINDTEITVDYEVMSYFNGFVKEMGDDDLLSIIEKNSPPPYYLM